MKLKLLAIWRLKFRSKVGQIKKDSRRFSLSCHVVKPQVFILSASSSRTHLVFIHLWSCRVDLDDCLTSEFHDKIYLKNQYRTHRFAIRAISVFHVKFIMVIELRGVQFGLKSYAWFQNQTSAQREFDLKSEVWFQTKIARPEVQLPLYYIRFEITQFNSLNTRTTRTTKVAKFAKQWPFCLSFSGNVIG